MLKVFQYPKCGTCKKALKWLDQEGVEYQSIDIVACPPSLALLKKLHKAGVPVAKLFNTSGQSYRAGNFKTRLVKMSDLQALEELAADGKLVKRPLVVGDGVTLVGFREADYAAAFLD